MDYYEAPDFDVKVHPKRVSRIERVLNDIGAHRDKANYTQVDFWRRFGITQSAGSRMEQGKPIPIPAQILIALEELGYVSQEQLIEAMRLVEEADGPRRGRRRSEAAG